MILGQVERNHVIDDKLWELVKKANHLTEGGYDVWDDNAAALVPVMERILALSKERQEWQIYFYDMAKLFWYVRRSTVNNIPLSFKLSEMFHYDFTQRLGENVGVFGREWRVDLASKILSFYCEYPQIDDGKLERMLGVFRECESRYGGEWNAGDYTSVMELALLNRDKKLAEEAAGKLKRAPFDGHCYCYVCTYARPMIGYYILSGEYEEAGEMVSRILQREIPAKYRWCFDECQQADEKEMKDIVLTYCLELAEGGLFRRFFAEWESFYRRPQEGAIDDTYRVLFHALAGDWSRQEERLLLAEEDDQGRREQKETPLDSLHWSLCWYCCFKLLHERGEGNVSLLLGEGSRREWSCQEASKYFEQQADLLGAQMDEARARFRYAEIKRCFEECTRDALGSLK